MSTSGNPPEIRAQLEKLAEVSRDLDRHTQLSKTACHPIQAQQVRKRIDELTEEQTRLMDHLVGQHPNQETRQTFAKLTAELDTLRDEIRSCDDKERLSELEAKIEETVDRWVHGFQVIVSEISGIAPPSKPVYGS